MGVPAVIENAVNAEMELISGVLSAHPHLPPIAFKSSFYSLVANDKTGKIQQCTTASLINCLSTAAALALMMQPQLGQFFILPFNMKGIGLVGTPVIGVKGYNSLGARDNYTINGEVVRDGDFMDYAYGTSPFVDHRPKGPQNETRRIIQSWSAATHLHRPAVVKVLEIEELVAVMNRSPAYKFGGETPYRDDKGIQLGLVAMYEKTPKRRLARNMPLNSFVMANAIESHFEGTARPAYIMPNKEAGTFEITDGVTGERKTPEEATREIKTDTPMLHAVFNRDGERTPFNSVDQWRAALMARADRITTKNGIDTLGKFNAECLREAMDLGHGGAVADVERYFAEKKAKLP